MFSPLQMLLFVSRISAWGTLTQTLCCIKQKNGKAMMMKMSELRDECSMSLFTNFSSFLF